MIIGSLVKLEVQQRHVAPIMCDKDKVEHYDVPFFIIREATMEEYLEYCKETNAIVSDSYKAKLERLKANYYEISID